MTLLSRRAMLTLPAMAVPKRKRRCKVGMQPDQSGVFFQLIIVGGGEFTYDAAGNLRTANVGQTTTDPIQGITCYAGFSTFNGHGAVISLFSSTLDAQLWYSDTGSSSQGALTSSVSSSSGTDPFGNAFVAGNSTYDPATSRLVEMFGPGINFNSTAGGSFIVVPGDVHLTDATSSGINPTLTLDSPAATHLSSGGRLLVVGPNSVSSGPPAQIILTDQSHFGLGTAALGEVQGSLAVGHSLGSVREWYAPSGGDDFAALNTALSSYGSADLLPGAYSLSAKLIVTGAALQGCDMATAIQPFGGYAGALLQCGSQGSIRNLGVQNGGTDAIVVPGGAAEWWLEDLLFSSNAGSCINATITGPTHGRIRGIRGLGGGTANGGGIRLDGGTGASVTAEVNLYDIDIQNCTASEILFCSAVTDIRCDGPLNGAIKSGVVSNGITIQGACQSIDLGSIDIGGGSGTDGVLAIKAAGGNSPTEIQAGPGVVQSSGAAVGVLVSDASARIWFDRIMSKRNHFDGWAWTGTGAFNRMSGCGGNLNNQAAGTAYDVNVTSSAHILNDGFSYVSGSTVAGRNISIVGNHYTEANPPSSLTSAGQAPAGW